MFLSKLSITNFRSIKCLEIHFQKDLNVFVGKNNTGKSSVIDAIRLALNMPMNNPNPIWITEDDFFKETSDSERSEFFEIKMEFSCLNDNQRTKFFEIVDFDLAEPNKSIARIIYRVSWPQKAKRFSIRRIGGPEGPEMSEIPQKIMDLFSVIYLPALRDAETALTSGNKSQLATLLKNLATEDDEKDVESIFSASNVQLSEKQLISDIVTGINSITKSVADAENNTSKIVAADADFYRILKTLQIQLDGNPVNDLSSNGLGSNNLLFMAVILQYLKSIKNDECPILLIEEPEAHLHPQMVLALSRYFSHNLSIDEKPQTFITTHSPTLVNDIPLDNMFLLFKKNRNICCNALKVALANPEFDIRLQRQFKRLMDITKSTLYFAKGVVLVEGISESLLIPILSERMGFDLSKKQISVIPINGVSFELFKFLFNSNEFDIPVSIITDSDPHVSYKDEKEKKWNEAYIAWDKLGDDVVSSRTKKLEAAFADSTNVNVYKSKITLEYDLALAGPQNALVIAKAWSLFGSPRILNETVINEINGLESRALRVWQTVCLQDEYYGKGYLAHNLADLLEEKNGKQYVYKFGIPKYIRNAIKHVIDNIG